jgi:hypothetical protein
MLRAIAFFLFLGLILLFSIVTSPVITLHFISSISACFASNSKKGERVFIAYDQLVNATFGGFLNWLFKRPMYKFGWPDETISSVLGKNIRIGGCDSSILIVDRWLSYIDPTSDHHCIDNVEDDEGF